MASSKEEVFPMENVHFDVPDNVYQTAEQLYISVRNNNQCRGRSTEELAAAILYSSYRIEEETVLCENVSNAYDVDKNRVMQASKYLQREVGLKFPPANPNEYLETFVEKLNIEDEDTANEIASKANQILQIVSSNSDYFNGKAPTNVATASIYSASVLLDDVQVTQKELSEISDTSTATIRKLYKEQLEIVNSSRIES